MIYITKNELNFFNFFINNYYNIIIYSLNRIFSIFSFYISIEI